MGGIEKNENSSKHLRHALNAQQAKTMEASIQDTHLFFLERKKQMRKTGEKKKRQKGMGCDRIELPTYGL